MIIFLNFKTLVLVEDMALECAGVCTLVYIDIHVCACVGVCVRCFLRKCPTRIRRSVCVCVRT